MIHLFEARRPGQARGIPIFTPSLPIYSVLRRWTNACLLSAEAQARITAVIEQEHDLGEDEDDGAGEQIQYAGVHMLTLASGQKAKGLQHSSPPQNYKEFKAEGLTDGGRPLSAPRNVSTGSSAEYNYSSGRLDQQRWHRSIRVRRERLERLVLNRILREWAAFAFTIPGYLPPGTPPVEKWSWCWRWDGFTSIDPVKDAKAATERLTNGTSSLDRECGELGEDWEDVQDQRLAEELREHRRRKELGLPEKAERQQGQRQPAPVEDDEDA
jgi:capsid protein